MTGAYRKISLPKDMVNAVEQHIKEYPELGYSSVAEFFKSAIRNQMINEKQRGRWVLEDAELDDRESLQ